MKEEKRKPISELAQITSGGIGEQAAVSEALVRLCREAAAEGAVLLKNDGVLPIGKEERVALFGRCATEWFCVGYGSGGDVVTPWTVSLTQGLHEAGIQLHQPTLDAYAAFAEAQGEPKQYLWGEWPLNYPEMPLDEALVARAMKESDLAVVVIGRAAGEDRESLPEKGSYYLTDAEEAMLTTVTAHFARVAVVMDIGSIMDFGWMARHEVGAVLIAWQGGMESGHGAADVLTGKTTPSGRLTDTIAKRYEDYPSAPYFGQKDGNNYAEDIFVGYRYFETFAPEKTLFPFGFGLSYTTFTTQCVDHTEVDGKITLTVQVENTGKAQGSETVQVYVSAPQGRLGQPARTLAAFDKTKCLAPNEAQQLTITFDLADLASYDDSGVTGHKSCWVLEAGNYAVQLGQDVHCVETVMQVHLPALRVVKQCSEVMAVKTENAFLRMVNRDGLQWETVPASTTNLKQMILDALPADIPPTGNLGIRLADVRDGRASMEAFVSQLDDDELEAITRGEGPMDSPFGTKGNAGIFGGVTESLRAKGIPPVVTTDGPAGIRLRVTCSLLPCGTLLACTWHTALVEALYHALGDEMLARGSDVLLAPGMNIHRNPLCGRNFEYFSEDTLLTGRMAAAVVNGIQHDGLSACPKHFACNNQETNRNRNDSRLTERALREIYLRGFAICIRESNPHTLMTSYNKINGVWSHYNWELIRTVLRGEWGWQGCVLTDWWMQYASSPEFPAMSGNGYRVRSGVDVLMPGCVSFMESSGASDGTLLATLGQPEGITRGEIQRVACEVLETVMRSSAMNRWTRQQEK